MSLSSSPIGSHERHSHSKSPSIDSTWLPNRLSMATESQLSSPSGSKRHSPAAVGTPQSQYHHTAAAGWPIIDGSPLNRNIHLSTDNHDDANRYIEFDLTRENHHHHHHQHRHIDHARLSDLDRERLVNQTANIDRLPSPVDTPRSSAENTPAHHSPSPSPIGLPKLSRRGFIGHRPLTIPKATASSYRSPPTDVHSSHGSSPERKSSTETLHHVFFLIYTYKLS